MAASSPKKIDPLDPVAVARKREILQKLEQIQEQAQLTLDELPLRLAKDRLRLIIGLARYLSTAVDVNWDPMMPRPESELPSRDAPR